MIPHEKTLVKRLEDQPFALVGINSDSEERYRKERPEWGVTWPSFFDGGATGGPIATQWGVSGWPTIYILDHEGKIRYQGPRGEAMDKAVDTLLVEMGITDFERGEYATKKPEAEADGDGARRPGVVPAAPLIPPARKIGGL